MDRAAILRKALLVRRVEDRLMELYAQGRIAGTLHSCAGQELCPAVLTEHLGPRDHVCSNHRGHGHFLCHVGDVAGLVAEIMGRETGVCGGRGGSQHLCADRFLSTGILGGQLPIAAGLAMAAQRAGEGAIAVAFLGDGALGEGVVYEVLNLVSRWGLPLLLVLENNRVAQSTPTGDALAGDICGRAEAFGIPARRGDTWDWERLWRVSGEAVRAVRDGGGPGFLVVDTYRLRAHSKGDDDRPADEVRRWAGRDPLNLLIAAGDGTVTRLLPEVDELLDRAVAAAEAAPVAAIPAPCSGAAPATWRPAPPVSGRVAEELRTALGRVLDEQPRALLLGEDIRSPYGGAFKVTRGLSDAHPDRVLNTPISEAAIVGLGTGLALAGHRPIVEVMFGDFIALAADQLLNHAAKLPYLRGDEPGPAVVVRTPMGGRRGYGPTHSQTLDRMFLGTPGLRVVALNSLVEPGHVLAGALAAGGPTLLIENKVLYTRTMGGSVPEGFIVELTADDPPAALVHPGGRPDVTLLGYGGMCDELLDACGTLFVEHDCLAQVLCPVQVWPFRVEPYLDRIAGAGALVVAEEGQGFAGFGAEVVAQLAEAGAAPPRGVARVAALPTPVPASPALERATLPGAGAVVAAALRLLGT